MTTIRIGGAFPPGSPPIPIGLGSGEFFFPPPGTYYFVTDASTVVQWFDSQAMIWRSLVPVSSAGYISCDGFNTRVLNITGQLVVASFTAGSAATNGIGSTATGVTLTSLTATPSHGRTGALFPIVGGATGAVTITNAGSGLLVPPLLVVSPPPAGGITAVLQATIAAGVIDAVTVINAGAGYTAVPTITVIPQMSGYAGMTLPPGTPVPPASPAALGMALSGPNAFAWPPYTFPNVGPYSTLPVLTFAAALVGSGTVLGWKVIDGGALFTGTPTATVAGTTGPATITFAAAVTAADATCYMQPILE